MNTFRARSTSEQLAEHLRQEILRGGLGDTMPGIKQLVRMLGVNSRAVEAAVKRLENEGLLVRQGSRRRRRIATQTFASGDTLELWVFAYAPSNDGNDTTNWVLGDGMDPTNGGDSDPLDGTGCILLLAQTFDLNSLSFTADQYFTFDFSASPLMMLENTAYGFLLGYTDGGGTGADYFEYKQANVGSYSGGKQIRTQGIPTDNTADNTIDSTFYLTGTAIPEPSAPALLLMSGAGLMIRRRRR